MILVDTSVWIGHLRGEGVGLDQELDRGAVLIHPWVTGELALGNLNNRQEILGLLRGLPAAPLASDDEVLILIDAEALAGTGIGYVDAQLLTSARLEPGAKLWTSDCRLAAAADRIGIGWRQAGFG